ncbi:OadG family protein [Limibacter armeniacum]|uniref:OadG family protein n=1 Tax=Limibacter armeniacum TaxID=466084 RepID=UPI002FE654C6
METNIETGLMLMAVGMSTVFVILTIVVIGGKLLIFFTNKQSQELAHQTESPPLLNTATTTNLDHKKLAALVVAVELATGGKGSVRCIRKIS